MGRRPCCDKVGLKKGRWTTEEDDLLRNYIQSNGEGCWRSLPKNAGLLRCGKSCRLRWINYLRHNLKRGNITPQEEELIVKLHSSFGNRWSLIASHLERRTDNEIKNYWNSHLSRKLHCFRKIIQTTPPASPRVHTTKSKTTTNKKGGGKRSKSAKKNKTKLKSNDEVKLAPEKETTTHDAGLEEYTTVVPHNNIETMTCAFQEEGITPGGGVVGDGGCCVEEETDGFLGPYQEQDINEILSCFDDVITSMDDIIINNNSTSSTTPEFEFDAINDWDWEVIPENKDEELWINNANEAVFSCLWDGNVDDNYGIEAVNETQQDAMLAWLLS